MLFAKDSPPLPNHPLHADHAAKQVEANGGAAQDRSKLYIGIGRAELNRTEFFQASCTHCNLKIEWQNDMATPAALLW